MLISDTHRFVFVHIPKTAGDSISLALRPWSQVIEIGTYKHATIGELYGQYFHEQPRAWEHYTTFAVVRNPWAFAHSAWRYCQMMNALVNGKITKELEPWANMFTQPSLADLRATGSPYYARKAQQTFAQSVAELCGWLHRGAIQNWLHVWDEKTSDRCAVQRILKFEKLESEWPKLCAQLLVGDVLLPRVNETVLLDGKEKGAYKQDYDRASRDLIAKHFACDIKWGQYEF